MVGTERTQGANKRLEPFRKQLNQLKGLVQKHVNQNTMFFQDFKTFNPKQIIIEFAKLLKNHRSSMISFEEHANRLTPVSIQQLYEQINAIDMID